MNKNHKEILDVEESMIIEKKRELEKIPEGLFTVQDLFDFANYYRNDMLTNKTISDDEYFLKYSLLRYIKQDHPEINSDEVYAYFFHQKF